MEPHLVSVIIPTYNRVRTVLNTIQSVLRQTYSNLEVIVVSDGFDDATKRVVENFLDPRIKYYEIEHSGRPAVPRNFGINKSCGEYIAFCDDDDIWMPEKLKLQLAKMQEDIDTGLVYTKCRLKNGKKESIVPRRDRQGSIFKELYLSSCFIATSSVMLKREVIDRIGLFDENIRLKAVEDFEFWLRIAKTYKVSLVKEPVVIHSENSSSLTKGVFTKIKRMHLVPCKMYRDNYVGLGLFMMKLCRMFCEDILLIMH